MTEFIYGAPVKRRSPIRSLLRLVVILTLLLSSYAKARYLASGALFDDALLGSRSLGLFIIAFESFFAVWTLSGLFSRWNRYATLALFSFFALVAFAKGVSGASSCGCFGAIQVNPWLTFALDAAIVALCFTSLTRGERLSNDRSRPRIAAWLSIATLLCAALVTVSAAPERGVLLVDADQKIPDGATVALLPERWLGAKFPLAKLCHTEVDLSVGRFAVMLSRAGCEECRAATKKYKALAEKSSARLVVLDVDNTASDEVIEGVFCGSLDSRFIWVVRTPVLLWIDNAIVDKVER